ncbi:hypothetical protein BC829DRAFT_288404 [Chytridium lagenaria]|nr:hypothetical protein BC829DRAFT_288404 [Chytridium lagenaria]
METMLKETVVCGPNNSTTVAGNCDRGEETLVQRMVENVAMPRTIEGLDNEAKPNPTRGVSGISETSLFDMERLDGVNLDHTRFDLSVERFNDTITNASQNKVWKWRWTFKLSVKSSWGKMEGSSETLVEREEGSEKRGGIKGWLERTGGKGWLETRGGKGLRKDEKESDSKWSLKGREAGRKVWVNWWWKVMN